MAGPMPSARPSTSDPSSGGPSARLRATRPILPHPAHAAGRSARASGVWIRPSAWALVLAAALTAGCPGLQTAAAGTITGQILYEGRPAQGETVSLLVQESGTFTAVTGSNGSSLTASTDANGDYVFQGLTAGTYRVLFLPVAVHDGGGVAMPSGEVASWYTLPGTVSNSAGTSFPAFDVSYDGLIYPQEVGDHYVSTTVPLPFHWSTDPQGQRYRLQIFENDSASGSPVIQLPWSSDPSALLRQNVNSDRYTWNVVIDGGNTGQGLSAYEVVDLAPPPPSTTPAGT